MSDDLMHYDTLTENAMRSVIRAALSRVAEDGVPGAHHFFITFDTNFEGVGMAERLRSAHPAAMTIVLQHQFRDLTVNDHAFSVELSFNQIPERLVIPFDAIISFFDPAVEFGLRFSHPEADLTADGIDGNDGISSTRDTPDFDGTTATPEGEKAGAQPKDGAKNGSDHSSDDPADDNIVSIDSFRKK